MMTKEDAQKEVQRLAAEAMELIRKAEKIADEHKVNFRFDVAYGMGGTYQGDPDRRYVNDEDGWQPSSMSC